MDTAFAVWFRKFMQNHSYAFVSGSDYAKLQEQVPADILQNAYAVYACSGNIHYVYHTEIHRNHWIPPVTLLRDLEQALKESTYRIQTGNHIEQRTGLINFSTVGRNCTAQQRQAYSAWDQITQERVQLCQTLRNRYTDLCFEIGGEISIDIYPRGRDKSQIIADLPTGQPIYFFGDGIKPGCNDYSLACALEPPSRSFPVQNWNDTWQQLQQF